MKPLMILLISVFSFSLSAADIAAGKKRAAVCAGCHGMDGISIVPTFPNLAGQKAAYTIKQLKAFKNKQRMDASMISQARALSDEDIENLAAYYESLGSK
jgi:cytochrome c553